MMSWLEKFAACRKLSPMAGETELDVAAPPCALPRWHVGGCAWEGDFNNENKGGWSHG